jgi:hypothetical protein
VKQRIVLHVELTDVPTCKRCGEFGHRKPCEHTCNVCGVKGHGESKCSLICKVCETTGHKFSDCTFVPMKDHVSTALVKLVKSNNMLCEIFSYFEGGEVIHKLRRISKRVNNLLTVLRPFGDFRMVRTKVPEGKVALAVDG